MENNVLSDSEIDIAIGVADNFKEYFPDFPLIEKKDILELILFIFILKNFLGSYSIEDERRTVN